MTDADKLKIAKKAILTALKRIQGSKEVAYLIGPGSNTYDQLCAAFCALSDQTLKEVRNNTIPGSFDIPHLTPEDMLDPDFR